MARKNSVTIEPSAATKARIERIVQVRNTSQREFLAGIVTAEVDAIWLSAEFKGQHDAYEHDLLTPPGPPAQAPQELPQAPQATESTQPPLPPGPLSG